MVQVSAFVASPEAKPRAAQQRPSDHHQWHSVGGAHRCPLARLARTIWPLAYGSQSFLPVAGKGVVAATPGAVAAAGRCHWRVGVGSTFRGWHRGSGPSTRRWSQKGGGDQALGRSQGGFGTKVHLRVEGKGKPVAFVLTPGQQHEARVFEELMTLGWVQRNGRGHPRIRPQRVCGDKGYSSRKIRAYLRRRGIRYTIPRKMNERRTGPFDKALYRLRNLVERTINRLKQLRRIATRYEKRADNYLAMLHIGSILLWL